MRVQRPRDRLVVQIEERLGDTGVVGRECEGPAELAVGPPAWQRIEDLLSLLVQLLAVQVRKPRARYRIEIGRQGAGLARSERGRREQQQHRNETRERLMNHRDPFGKSSSLYWRLAQLATTHR